MHNDEGERSVADMNSQRSHSLVQWKGVACGQSVDNNLGKVNRLDAVEKRDTVLPARRCLSEGSHL